MKHTIANVLRNLAVIAVNVAEELDPQPPITMRTFTIYGDGTYSDTTANLGNVKWHRTG